MTELVRYEEMRVRLAECVRVDEAADIRDKAAALAAYARQRDDTELEVWTAEIRLRAIMRIGQLSAELEGARHGGAGGGSKVQPGELSKTDQLAQAGISKAAAHGYEAIAGGKDKQAQLVATASAETYFAQQRNEQTPATIDGLRGAIREGLTQALGPPPARQPRHKTDPRDDALLDLTQAIRRIAEFDGDLTDLTQRVHDNLASWHLGHCRLARVKIRKFEQLLAGRISDAA